MSMIDAHFGLSPDALAIRARRFELLSANLANADTPGYKARDIDFADALARERQGVGALKRTHETHLLPQGSSHTVQYRVPAQVSLDGNTVETQQEHAAFMDNAIRYQASLNFLDGRIKSMLLALRGE